MALPLARMPVVCQQFFDANGAPLENGYLQFFDAGTTTPQEVFADVDGNTSLGVEVDLDASGIAPSIFFASQGYKVEVYDQDDNLITALSGDDVEDVGQAFLQNLGSYQADGRRDLTSGATILPTDLLVTVDGTGGADPCIINLEPVADRTEQLIIMNVGDVDIAVTPDGSDTINFVAAAYTLAAGTTPDWPTITLLPSHDDSGYIVTGSANLP